MEDYWSKNFEVRGGGSLIVMAQRGWKERDDQEKKETKKFDIDRSEVRFAKMFGVSWG